MASERLSLMELPSGVMISQLLASVELLFPNEDDAEKFYIVLTECMRRGTPLTIEPASAAAAPKKEGQ